MTHAPNVLLLDQDHTLRRATALLLANRGAGVSAAETLEEALALCRRRIYDVALIDLEPPLPGAAEVLRLLRREPLAPRRIVLCSGEPIPGEDAEALGEVLLKPYAFDRLMQLVFGKARRPARSGVLARSRATGRVRRDATERGGAERGTPGRAGAGKVGAGERPIRPPRPGGRGRRRLG